MVISIRWRFLILAALVSALVVAPAGAQTITKVKDILANPRAYVNEVVTVEGFATQWVASTATSTSFFFLKDDWGDIIKIRTSREKPENGGRYRVSGPVGVDVVNANDVFVSEEGRVDVWKPGTGATAAPPVIPPKPEVPVVLIAAVALVLVVLAGLLIFLLNSRRKGAEVGPGGVGGPTSGPADEPAPQPVEGTTIKMFAPPPGTLKLLPGRLEVVAGDSTVKEIRFYRVKGQSTPEMTFGRVAGPAYTHIQLKPMTVSSRQAKFTYLNNQWVLTNFAAPTSNPTRYNGTELPVDGQAAMKEGDRVEMGEVQLVFHES